MNGEPTIYRFDRQEALLDAAVARLAKLIRKVVELSGFCSLAFSGIPLPDEIFAILAQKCRKAEFWTRVQLFWLDEWCVPADAPESNYGRAWRLLSSIPSLLPANVHRIEAEKPDAAELYGNLLKSAILLKNDVGLPIFDIIVLGVGINGQIAGLSPYSPYLKDDAKLMAARVSAAQPGFERIDRITVTLPVINAGRKIMFMACGKEMIDLVQHVINRQSEEFPVSLISSVGKKNEWHICI